MMGQTLAAAARAGRGVGRSNTPPTRRAAMRRIVCVWFVALLAATGVRADDKALREEHQSLKGPWRLVNFLIQGQAMPKEEIEQLQPTFTFKDGQKATFSGRGEPGAKPGE